MIAFTVVPFIFITQLFLVIEVAFAIASYLIYMTCQHGSWHCCRHKDIFCGCKTCWHFKYMNIFIFLFFITTIILKCFYDLWILIIYPTSALHLTSVIVGLHIISHYLLIKPLKCLHTIEFNILYIYTNTQMTHEYLM